MAPDALAGTARIADRLMALSREWDELVEQVRRLDGFEDFLRADPLSRTLAGHGREVATDRSGHSEACRSHTEQLFLRGPAIHARVSKWTPDGGYSRSHHPC